VTRTAALIILVVALPVFSAEKKDSDAVRKLREALEEIRSQGGDVDAALKEASKQSEPDARPSAKAQDPAPAAALPNDPSEIPSLTAAKLLFDIFGEWGVDALKKHSYALYHGKHEERLEFLRFQELEALAKESKASRELIAALVRFSAGKPVDEPGVALGFASLASLPSTGVMTPRLHALRLLLTAAHEERGKLLSAGKSLTLLEEDTLFDESWGRRLEARNRLEAIENPAEAAEEFYDTMLAGIRPDTRARRHFSEFMTRAYDQDPSGLIAADWDKGRLSDALRANIQTYLRDQRGLHALRTIRSQVKSLESGGRLTADLKDLERLAVSFEKRPDALGDLWTVMAREGPAAKVQLISTGLYAQKPPKLGRYEPGDPITVGGGYWVDGIPEGERIAVQETTFLDLGPRGLAALESRVENRATGGPYTFNRTFKLPDGGPAVFRVLLGTPLQKALAQSLDVAIAGDLERERRRLAGAYQKAFACELPAADAEHERFEKDSAPAAKEKKQYQALIEESELGHHWLRVNASRLEKVKKLSEEAKEDLEPARCRFETKRTRAALELARSLPPGCMGPVPELEARLELLRRRSDDQRYFLKAAEKGRALSANCEFAEASELWIGALAVLKNDPEARCGEVDAAAKAVEAELVPLKIEEYRKAESRERIAAAEKLEDKVAAARELRTLRAAQSELPHPKCFAFSRDRADSLARDWVRELPVPDDAAIAKLLPEEADAPAASAKVEPAPEPSAEPSVEAAVAPPVEAIERKPELPQPSMGPTERLDCLERGIRQTKKAVDCHGNKFQIAELSKLRKEARAKPAPAKKPAAKPGKKGKK
jgi:Sec-independent protein translocase protein TatA